MLRRLLPLAHTQTDTYYQLCDLQAHRFFSDDEETDREQKMNLIWSPSQSAPKDDLRIERIRPVDVFADDTGADGWRRHV